MLIILFHRRVAQIQLYCSKSEKPSNSLLILSTKVKWDFILLLLCVCYIASINNLNKKKILNYQLQLMSFSDHCITGSSNARALSVHRGQWDIIVYWKCLSFALSHFMPTFLVNPSQETDSYLLYKFEAPMMILVAVILKALYTKCPGLM